MSDLLKKLNKIQQELKAPKSQINSFGRYNYRSCEDILEAVKPLLDGAVIIISDEIVNVGDRYYVKATATLKDGQEEISNTAYAREAEEKKGMDSSQVTGATSSYARKYALNGLLLIDDTKDADTDEHQNTQKTAYKPATEVYTPPVNTAQVFDKLIGNEPPEPVELANVPVREAVAKLNSYKTPKAGDKCSKCGAEMVLNPKTQKVFCSNRCWTK